MLRIYMLRMSHNYTGQELSHACTASISAAVASAAPTRSAACGHTHKNEFANASMCTSHQGRPKHTKFACGHVPQSKRTNDIVLNTPKQPQHAPSAHGPTHAAQAPPPLPSQIPPRRLRLPPQPSRRPPQPSAPAPALPPPPLASPLPPLNHPQTCRVRSRSSLTVMYFGLLDSKGVSSCFNFACVGAPMARL